MSSTIKILILVLLAATLLGCKGMEDDLNPSGEDLRTIQHSPETIGKLIAMGEEGEVNLKTAAANNKGMVLYFTMWCPICNSHTDHLISKVMPHFPEVDFYLVDYVNATLDDAQSARDASGYATSDLILLLDHKNQVQNAFDGTMGIIVVINPAGEVLLHEDFKDGKRLKAVLNQL